MKPTENDQVRRFRRQLAGLLVLDRSLRFLAIAGFVGGGVILALRIGLGWSFGTLSFEKLSFERLSFEKLSFHWLPAIVALVFGLVLVLAAHKGLKALPDKATVRALLDRHQGWGGLLMADTETDLGTWRTALHSARPASAALPRLHWRSTPAWTLFGAAVVFILVSFLVPPRSLDASGPRPLDLATEITELEESLKVLEEEGLMDGEEAERLDLALETLAEEASGNDPARAWETLDHLSEMAEQTAEEAAEAALTEGERLVAAEQVALALEQDAGPSELEAGALEELAGLASQAAEQNRLLDQSLADALAQAAASGDPARMKKALTGSRESLEAKLNRLHKAGLIDLETLIQGKESLAAGDDALAAFLGENGLEAAGAYCQMPGAGQMPGTGAATRGPGHAEMTWADPSSEEGAVFEEQVLDPSSLAALERSGLIGLRAADPRAGGRQPLPSSGASGLDPTASAGGAAHTQSVLPRHRAAVRRFFERGDGK